MYFFVGRFCICVHIRKCISVGKECVSGCKLTKLAHFEDLTEHLGKLDAAAAERTLVLVFSAAVLQDDLNTQSVE